MIAIVTVLFAFPLGFLLRSRTSALLGYVALYAWAFTYQGVYLMLNSLHGDANPAFKVGSTPVGYGVVSFSIYAVGTGLVFLGHRVGSRRRSRRAAAAASPVAAAEVATV
jgi:hypothetical protein